MFSLNGITILQWSNTVEHLKCCQKLPSVFLSHPHLPCLLIHNTDKPPWEAGSLPSLFLFLSVQAFLFLLLVLFSRFMNVLSYILSLNSVLCPTPSELP